MAVLTMGAGLAGMVAAEEAQADMGQHFVASKEKGDIPLQLIKPTDPAFVYEGRFDMKKPDAPVITWQASRILAGFEGRKLVVNMEILGGQVYLDVVVDGVSRILELKGRNGRWVLQDDLAPGTHSLMIFKRSEASGGTCRFKGIEVEAGTTLSKPVISHARRIIFFGDSITAGACNEDGATDQFSKFLTHNAAKSWAAFVARALDADHQNIAVSGMGMVTGWNSTVFAPQIWDRLTFAASGPQADLASWVPDLVFINLGENDGSFTSANNKPFPPEFEPAYEAYVKSIRQAWPKSRIVLLRGGMYNGTNNQDLIAAWDQVVAANAKDPLVSSYVFKHWTGNHPRVADDQAMAEELVTWLKEQKLVK